MEFTAGKTKCPVFSYTDQIFVFEEESLVASAAIASDDYNTAVLLTMLGRTQKRVMHCHHMFDMFNIKFKDILFPLNISKSFYYNIQATRE